MQTYTFIPVNIVLVFPFQVAFFLTVCCYGSPIQTLGHEKQIFTLVSWVFHILSRDILGFKGYLHIIQYWQVLLNKKQFLISGWLLKALFLSNLSHINLHFFVAVAGGGGSLKLSRWSLYLKKDFQVVFN